MMMIIKEKTVMLSKETRETYYSMVREALDHRMVYIHNLLRDLEKDHEELSKTQHLLERR